VYQDAEKITTKAQGKSGPSDIAVDWLQSTLITRTAPRYQAAVGVLVHALTNGFFWRAAWLIAGGCAICAAILVSGQLRRIRLRRVPPQPAGA
jgi:hypothetical protein